MRVSPTSPNVLPVPVETVGDWLRTAPTVSQTTDDAGESPPLSAERMALALCVGELLNGDAIVHPSPHAMQRSAEALRTLPPQMSDPMRATAFGYWMGVAALAELARDVPLARMVLNALESRISDDTELHRTSTRGTMTPSTPPAWEMRGMIWARRGRLSRLAGHLEDAEECYREAARIGRKQRATEALAQAQIGLALLAAMRGNHPAVLRRCRALLAHHPDLGSLYRVPVHQLIALSARKKGRFSEALRNVWYAFESLDQADFRRSELVLSMAEIAEEVGDGAAALHAFETVLHAATHARIRTPALLGAIRLYIAVRRSPSPPQFDQVLEGYRQEAKTLLESTTDPFDGAALLIGLATIAEHSQDWAEWDRRLSAARSVAEESKLFELQFRIERMRAVGAGQDSRALAATPVGVDGAPQRGTRPTPEARRLIAKIHTACLDGLHARR